MAFENADDDDFVCLVFLCGVCAIGQGRARDSAVSVAVFCMSGVSRAAVNCCGLLWTVVNCCGLLWTVVDHSETQSIHRYSQILRLNS